MLEHAQCRLSVDSIRGIDVNADSRTTYRVVKALAKAFAHALFNVHDGLFRKTGNIN